MMSFCTHCGSREPEGLAFCGSCGRPMTISPTISESSHVPQQNIGVSARNAPTSMARSLEPVSHQEPVSEIHDHDIHSGHQQRYWRWSYKARTASHNGTALAIKLILIVVIVA